MDVSTLQKGDRDCRLSFIVQNHNGFSLIELISTLAVVSILILSIPSISTAFISSNQLITTVNKIASDMAYARTEAIMRGINVELCKSNNNRDCAKTVEWESGWIVFVDSNKNRKRENSEEILRVQPAINIVNVTYRGTGSSNYIRFKPDGSTGVNGTFAFCSDSKGVYKRALILFRTGRLRLSKTRADGSPISCANYRTN